MTVYWQEWTGKATDKPYNKRAFKFSLAQTIFGYFCLKIALSNISRGQLGWVLSLNIALAISTFDQRQISTQLSRDVSKKIVRKLRPVWFKMVFMIWHMYFWQSKSKIFCVHCIIEFELEIASILKRLILCVTFIILLCSNPEYNHLWNTKLKAINWVLITKIWKLFSIDTKCETKFEKFGNFSPSKKKKTFIRKPKQWLFIGIQLSLVLRARK